MQHKTFSPGDVDPGPVIRARREELGLGRERFGRIIDKSANTIMGWETGESFPDFESLVALVRDARIPAHMLLGSPPPDNVDGETVAA
jgi:transcriptional regulator with XRE-family HTH domain